ncbi:MAG: hypothetical protein EZS28_044538, partial [Streblomastix strix]
MTVYINEILLEAAGLTDFPELYTYIKERGLKPVEEQPQLVPIGEQTLQDQVKQNAAIINDEQNEFIPPQIENIQPKVDIQDGLELAEGCTWLVNQSMQQLSVSKKKVTYNFSLKTTKYFHGNTFENWPEQVKPRLENKIVIIIGSDSIQKNNIFEYIDQNGPYVSLEGDEDIQSDITIILSSTYNTEYTPIKQALHDSNNDNQLDIQDTLNEIAKGGEYKTQSWVNDTVKPANKATSKIDEEIVQHQSKIGRAPLFTDYTITDFMDQVQFADYFRNGQIEIINE